MQWKNLQSLFFDTIKTRKKYTDNKNDVIPNLVAEWLPWARDVVLLKS
jgi:hypothetical protein